MSVSFDTRTKGKELLLTRKVAKGVKLRSQHLLQCLDATKNGRVGKQEEQGARSPLKHHVISSGHAARGALNQSEVATYDYLSCRRCPPSCPFASV